MRPVLFAFTLVVLVSGTGAAQPRRSGQPAGPLREVWAPERLERLGKWLKAVDEHEPGEADDALTEVGGWTNTELRGLWVDVAMLAQVMRFPRTSKVTIQPERQQRPTEIRYTSSQLQKLRAFGCAATGNLEDRECAAINLQKDLDADLRRLASHVVDYRHRTGDDNYLVRRAALLHTDVAMLVPMPPVEPLSTPPSVGPQSVRLDISDGRSIDLGFTALHWDIARMVLDRVTPRGASRPAPGSDAMVRDWYRATAAWMQHTEQHDKLHLDRAREIFPGDPDILFLSGCQRETYSEPAIQSAARSAALPPGYSVDVEPEKLELRQAETFFRRALAERPAMGEAHLRLGRVRGRLGQHADAAGELRQALSLVSDDQLRYYGELFLGAEAEALGAFEDAGAAYQRAQELFPGAQSPLLARSELQRRRGDRAGSLKAIQEVFDLPSAGDEARDDPWWVYHVAQARDADALVDALRRPFISAEPR